MRTLQQPPPGFAPDQRVQAYRNGRWIEGRYSHTDKAGDVWVYLEWTDKHDGHRVAALEYFSPRFVRAKA